MGKTKSTLAQIRQFRIDKANALREKGIEPYPTKASRTNYSDEIKKNYSDFKDKKVTLAGRLMSWREHGHIIFGDIQDQKGVIQLYIKEDTLNATNKQKQSIGFEDLELLDIGDIIEATGIITKTKSGEISILAQQIKILTKAIRPLPEKWIGLTNKEKIFRKRYLDLIVNPEKKYRFEKSAQIVAAIRQFLNDKGFLEIKTPIIQPLYGGTNARPFKTYMNALSTDFYLAISHELYLKRLITAGFDNVYNIAGYFRNEGIDRSHNPEFQMIETMSAFHNYEYNMDLIEELYQFIGKNVFKKNIFKVSGQDVDFSKPWERIMMIDAVKKYADINFNKINDIDSAHNILAKIGYEEDKPNTIGECMVKVFEEKVEEQLIQPTFITGHPVEISPLAKQMPSDSRFVERFEIFIGGIEGGDNWTELNDPVELYERLKEQVERGRGGDDEFHPMDVDFIECMEYGMPPTTGLGPGIERLQMMYLETEYIDDVIFFPIQRPAPPTELQKELYGAEYLESKEKELKIQSIEQKDLDKLPSKIDALDLLHKYVDDDYQVLHAKMVAAAMQDYAEDLGANPHLWYITGLLHDLDYAKYPDKHPYQELEWFKEWKYPDQFIHAVAAHDHLTTGEEPETLLAAVLLAVDELSGILYAYSKMRDKNFSGMKAKSAIKKLEDKNFAAKISRDEIKHGIKLSKLDLEPHIKNMITTFDNMKEFGGDKDYTDKVETKVHSLLTKKLKLAEITSEVKEKFPGIKFGYIVLEDVKVDKKDKNLDKLKKEIISKLESQYTDKSEIKENDRIEGFRKIYKNSGVDPNSRLNSAEALLRRIVSGNGIYNVNNVVDTYNITSAELGIPMAAYDLDKIEGRLSLRFANKGESIIRIGEEKPKLIEKGELVYADNKGITCMDFNYRDADRTKITKETNKIIVFIDGHQTISQKEILSSLNLLGQRLETYTEGKVIGYGTSWEEDKVLNEEIKQDMSRKMVIVVDKTLENWKVLNIVGHVSAYLGHQMDEKFSSGPAYRTKDGVRYDRSCQYPIIVLQTDSSKLLDLKDQSELSDILSFSFTKQHLEIEKDEDVDASISNLEEKEIELYGVGLVGEKEKLDKLTNNFKLWK
ncbi:lysine--tRNA ligase [Candidatus Dojkabacteria bacterium]|nr:lysine--tRNA ligase [Candidatus Dojkabacteria bacterium]